MFHASLLRFDPNDPLPRQRNEPPPPVMIDGEGEFEVDRILDSRYYYGRLQYRVKSVDREPDYTWYNAESFENSKEVVESFHKEYPQSCPLDLIFGYDKTSSTPGGRPMRRFSSKHYKGAGVVVILQELDRFEGGGSVTDMPQVRTVSLCYASP